jgi:hypothetical protein
MKKYEIYNRVTGHHVGFETGVSIDDALMRFRCRVRLKGILQLDAVEMQTDLGTILALIGG